MAKKKVAIGDRVTVRRSVEAYGSNRDIQVFMTPGTVGIVGAVDVPYVRGPNSTFTCVDFESTVAYSKNSATPYRWRCGVSNDNLVLLEKESAS